MDLHKAYEEKSGNTIDLVDIPADSFPSTVQTKWATGARPDILEWHSNQVDVLSLNAAKNMIDLSALPFVKKEGTLADVSGKVGGKVSCPASSPTPGSATTPPRCSRSPPSTCGS